ncbi:probable serine/threonine protein kinase IREH1 [Humulus lupulus]|uniref:probable serine/threonine protein kinase IREH1 n=1 Tax=Humulus lupulus TaxID=3486 RepID=UPI002B4086C3|nr:probable serine/threonine protein kinase IREH1 [Humulus lupulus]
MIRKNAVESILAERDILISVRNPFVVRFFYSFTCRENLYLVMEYLNGGDLYSLLRNLGCLEEDVARVYIAEVVLALEYLHSLCVVHRDLKPDNLLIAHDGHIKLTDFGLSKVGLINSTDELSGPAVSTTSLMVEDELELSVPEHQQERRKKRTTADWWSVGVILFELIVGIPPFNAEHPQAEGSSAESIAALAKVDTVKQRMEAAYETLQDAAGLTQLSSTVEDVFASGDLPRVAETLANMRHCLSTVGEVAEFANVRKQLEVLEDRLDAMVQPRLTDALSSRKVTKFLTALVLPMACFLFNLSLINSF